jgi:hypothetical protein
MTAERPPSAHGVVVTGCRTDPGQYSFVLEVGKQFMSIGAGRDITRRCAREREGCADAHGSQPRGAYRCARQTSCRRTSPLHE